MESLVAFFKSRRLRAVGVLAYAVPVAAISAIGFDRVAEQHFYVRVFLLGLSVTFGLAALVALPELFGVKSFKFKTDLDAEKREQELAAAREKAQVPGLEGQPSLQNLAINAYRANLQNRVEGLRRRAFWSFVPGAALCVAALLGPLVAYELAKDTEVWQFMLGGSALAIVLLGSGTALLRHDAKLNELAQATQTEYLYFSRLLTALDCAQALGPDVYKATLAEITRQLVISSPLISTEAASRTETRSDARAEPKASSNGAEGFDASSILIEAAKLVALEKSKS